MAIGFGGLADLANHLDREVPSLILIGAIKSAERTVEELQQAGPSWSGRFSNSWQIKGPQGQGVEGDGKPGDPRPIKFMQGPFTGRQATATLFRVNTLKDKVIFRISNFSDYFDQATDRSSQPKNYYPQGWELFPDGPDTRLGKKNFDPKDEGRKKFSRRGETGGGDPDSTSSRTAPLDWFPTFAGSGRIDRAVKIEMDKAFKGVFK